MITVNFQQNANYGIDLNLEQVRAIVSEGIANVQAPYQ